MKAQTGSRSTTSHSKYNFKICLQPYHTKEYCDFTIFYKNCLCCINCKDWKNMLRTYWNTLTAWLIVTSFAQFQGFCKYTDSVIQCYQKSSCYNLKNRSDFQSTEWSTELDIMSAGCVIKMIFSSVDCWHQLHTW